MPFVCATEFSQNGAGNFVDTLDSVTPTTDTLVYPGQGFIIAAASLPLSHIGVLDSQLTGYGDLLTLYADDGSIAIPEPGLLSLALAAAPWLLRRRAR